MASKKGIAITAAIAAGIIAASSLIWFIPQSNNGLGSNPRSVQDTFSSVYSQSNDMATNANATYSEWLQGKVSSDVVMSNVSQFQNDAASLKDSLIKSNPPADYQKSFSTYETALDSLGAYLAKIKDQVSQPSASQNATSTARTPSPDVLTAWRNWQSNVDESVGALPVGS